MMRQGVVGAGFFSLLVACGGAFGPSTTTNAIIDDAACPELRGGAMNATFAADAHANATIRTFVAASGDLASAAADAEAAVTRACQNIGRDLGLGRALRRRSAMQSAMRRLVRPRLRESALRAGPPLPAPRAELETRLARGERTIGNWRRDLAKIEDHDGYREAALPREELWRIVEDASAPEDARAGAALVLRRLDDAPRLRVAADAVASPKLRVALETAADLEIDDAELDEKLRALR